MYHRVVSTDSRPWLTGDLWVSELERIRTLVAAATAPERASVPVPELVALVATLRDEVGLTLDLPSSRSLGYPVVVVRPPSGPRTVDLSVLSPRERQVAALITEGLRNREIADKLGISLGTAKDHVHHILDKTGLGSRAAVAVAYALDPSAA